MSYLFWAAGIGLFIWLVVSLINILPSGPRRKDILPGELWLDEQGNYKSIWDEDNARN